jgi:hypothetical protein
MAKGRVGSSIKKKLGMVVYGDPFTGKSTFASQLMFMHNEDGTPMKVLYIDCESGSIDYYIDDIEAKGGNTEELYIVYTQSLGEVLNFIEKVKNREEFYVIDEEGNETDEILLDKQGNPWIPDALVVDGITVLNSTIKQGLVEFSKKRAKVRADDAQLFGEARLVKVEGASIEQKDYQTIRFKQSNLILSLIASGVHWICTAREASEKVYEKDADGKQISVETGKKVPEGFGKDCVFNAHTSIRFTRDEYGDVVAICDKDRTGVHMAGEVISNPQLSDWQKVIDGSADKKEFIVKNDRASAVATEQKLYTEEILGNMESSNATSGGVQAKEIIAEINATMKAMSQDERTAKKNALVAANLAANPTAIGKLTDTDALNQILAIIKS